MTSDKSPSSKESSPETAKSPKSPEHSPPPSTSGHSPIRARSPSASPRDRSPEDEKVARTPSRSPPPRRRSRTPERRDRDRRDRSPDERQRRRDDSRERRHRRDDEDRRRKRSRSRDRNRSVSPKRRKDEEQEKNKEEPVKEKKEPVDILRSRAGGAYIPPAKLRMMQEQMTDKTGEQYQRVNWERLKKRILGEVNKVNVGNLVGVVRSLLQENIVRGKGLLTRSIMQAQAFSPGFSHVYAALVAVINSKFPFIGDLLVRRLVVQFKRCFRRGDKGTAVTVTKFIAHLINQHVAHEILGLEVALLMLEKPTDDSVEVAVAFIKECGMKLMEVAPGALRSVYDRLRTILNETEGGLDKRTQYIIEAAMAIHKEKFSSYPAVVEDLDLIEESEQTTHIVTLEDAIDPENTLNIFKFDPEFEKNEAEYDEIRREVIGDADESDDEDEEGDEDKDDDEEEAPKSTVADYQIIDNTEERMVAFRREIYLTIQSSLDYQEAAHKLLKLGIKPEMEPELCHMLVDCCAQQRTYERFYGFLIERFCRLKREFQETFQNIIRDTYKTIHRFEITKLRNMARLTAHLLRTDAIDWMVLDEVKLNERDTTSAGRIYLREIFQELVREMGMVKVYERTVDPTLQRAFAGIFPRDNPEDTRFSINFFTIIGLGSLSIDLREFLEKGGKKKKAKPPSSDTDSSSDSSDSSSDSDSSDSSDSEDSSSSSSSSSDSEDEKKKKKKKKKSHSKKEKHGEEKKIKVEPESPGRAERHTESHRNGGGDRRESGRGGHREEYADKHRGDDRRGREREDRRERVDERRDRRDDRRDDERRRRRSHS